MKRILIYLFCILTCTLIVSVLPVSGEEAIYEDVMRLHVIANSDSEDDQELKLAVRDRLISEYPDVFSASDSVDEAREKILANAEELKACAEELIRERGYDYSVEVTVGTEHFDRREYSGCSLPSGEYLTCKITIGEGKGKNWWCVLFPRLTEDIAAESSIDYSDVSAYLSDSQYKLIFESGAGEYQVKFKVLELLESAFAK